MIDVSLFEKELEIADPKNGSKIDSIKEREVNQYWERRDNASVLWCYLITFSNIGV